MGKLTAGLVLGNAIDVVDVRTAFEHLLQHSTCYAVE